MGGGHKAGGLNQFSRKIREGCLSQKAQLNISVRNERALERRPDESPTKNLPGLSRFGREYSKRKGRGTINLLIVRRSRGTEPTR